jgi:hypothetical protein
MPPAGQPTEICPATTRRLRAPFYKVKIQTHAIASKPACEGSKSRTRLWRREWESNPRLKPMLQVSRPLTTVWLQVPNPGRPTRAPNRSVIFFSRIEISTTGAAPHTSAFRFGRTIIGNFAHPRGEEPLEPLTLPTPPLPLLWFFSPLAINRTPNSAEATFK